LAARSCAPALLVSLSSDSRGCISIRRLQGPLPAYYATLGWKPIEEVEYLGKMRTVMVFDVPE